MQYDYIKRAYGSSFYPGDGVLHRENGREGTVLPPKPSHTHYVHVDFGDVSGGLCHPHALKIMRRGREWGEAQEAERALIEEG